MEYKIPLNNKTGEPKAFAIVSKEDYEELNQYKWSKINDGYAAGYINGKKWRMHRYIIIKILKNDINSTIKVDHYDKNKLNNQRYNIDIATNSENARNRKKKENTSSHYFNVSFDKIYKKYRS